MRWINPLRRMPTKERDYTVRLNGAEAMRLSYTESPATHLLWRSTVAFWLDEEDTEEISLFANFLINQNAVYDHLNHKWLLDPIGSVPLTTTELLSLFIKTILP